MCLPSCPSFLGNGANYMANKEIKWSKLVLVGGCEALEIGDLNCGTQCKIFFGRGGTSYRTGLPLLERVAARHPEE